MANSINRIIVDTLTATSHIKVDGYTIDLSSGATTNQVLQYNGTSFVAATSSGGVSSVSNSDSTLTISPTTGAVVASLNLSHANTWSATQTFSSHIIVDGYTIDISAGATSGQALAYNGTKFVATTVSGGGSGIGSTGNKLISIVPAGSRATGTSATPLVVHSFAFDPSIYTFSSTTVSVVFRAVAATGNTTVTGHVKLRDITSAVDITTFNLTNQTTQAKSEQTLTVSSAGTNTIANSEKVYEIRIYVDSPSLIDDTLEFYSAEIRVINTVN